MIYPAQQAKVLASYPEVRVIFDNISAAVEAGDLSMRMWLGLAPGYAQRIRSGLESLGYTVTAHGTREVTEGELTWTEYDVEISWDV